MPVSWSLYQKTRPADLLLQGCDLNRLVGVDETNRLGHEGTDAKIHKSLIEKQTNERPIGLWGQAAKKLKLLPSAPALGEVISFKPHTLRGDTNGQHAGSLVEKSAVQSTSSALTLILICFHAPTTKQRTQTQATSCPQGAHNRLKGRCPVNPEQQRKWT